MYSNAYARNMSSRVCMVLSDWPLVCGWKAMLRFNSVPIADWNHPQNLEASLVSRSDTIERGTPCNCTIFLMYSSANCSTLKVAFIANKCADLVSRSTITQKGLDNLRVRGVRIMKSIVMCSHFQTGMGKACKKPSGFWSSVFTRWKLRHRATYYTMSLFIHAHQ